MAETSLKILDIRFVNRISGHIRVIETDGALSLVTVDVGNGLLLSCIVIDTPDSASYLVPDRKVDVLFKETEVVIGLDPVSGISLSNKIPCEIEGVKSGTLLCSLDLQCKAGRIHAIISARSAKTLGLMEGKAVWAMIKLNELMLSPQ
jgi:molybdopterin-binding protein